MLFKKQAILMRRSSV